MAEQADPIPDIADTHDNTPTVKGEDTRTVPFSAMVDERKRAEKAKRAADAAEARAKAAEEARAKLEAEAAEWRKSHEAWTAHQTAESERSKKALADRLAALPEEVRADIEDEIEGGMAPGAVLRWIERAEKMAAGTKPAEPAKPGFPAGGRGPTQVPSQDELTPEQRAWAEANKLPAGQMTRATVEALMKVFKK